MSFPSCPASVFSGVHPGCAQTLAVQSYDDVRMKSPVPAKWMCTIIETLTSDIIGTVKINIISRLLQVYSISMIKFFPPLNLLEPSKIKRCPPSILKKLIISNHHYGLVQSTHVETWAERQGWSEQQSYRACSFFSSPTHSLCYHHRL